ncbi:Alpha/beta hydrolase family protein (fragment) [Candidatus Roizmanbacteria bacterium]
MFVNKLELKKINLIGHSFGGRITIKMAAENPDFLQKVVLVDSAGIYHHSQVKTFKLLIASIIRPLFQFSFMQSFRRKIYQITGSEEYLAIPALSKTFSHIVSEDLTSYLPQIKLSTLIIWGNKDNNEASTIADVQLMKKNIPNSKLEILKNAGHFSFLDKPEEFNRELIKFID